MRFAFSEDQLLLAEAARSFLARECRPERLREAWDGQGHLGDIWAGLAAMGATGLLVPEAEGGLALTEIDLVLVVEETGRAGLPGPFVETVAVAAPAFASMADSRQRTAWLSGIADGSLLVGAGICSPLATCADIAGLVLADHDGALLAVPTEALDVQAQPSIDRCRRLFSYNLDDAARSRSTEVIAENPDRSALGDAFDRGALAAAAQLIGLSDRMLDMTVDYVKERQQFGVPIGSFQAVKHRLADALLAVSFARPAVYNAAYSTACGLEDRSRDVSVAKALSSEAAAAVSSCALQCHGAIGYTVEYDLHLYMKRSWALCRAWGDASWHRDRVGAALGI